MRKKTGKRHGGRPFAKGHDSRRHTLTPEERAKGRKTWALRNLCWGDMDAYFAARPLAAP